MELDDERMVYLLKHTPLTQNGFYFILPYNFVGFQDLDCVGAACVELSREHYSAEPSAAYHFDLLEVLNADWLPLAHVKKLITLNLVPEFFRD
jgi:hypothetical protein